KFELAALMSFENGKNRYEAMADVDEAADLMRWYAAEMLRNQGYERPMGQFLPGETTRSILKPYGVWAVVAPFNFPLAIAAGMSTGALITGNTVVFKPASDTPYMGLRLAELLAEAGLPPGVFNYITGPGATVGQELVENSDVDGFVFTGSRAVGLKAFKRFTAGRPKPIITEMGGKNPTIVAASADLDKAALGVVRAAFGYGGQKCSACSRVLVERGVKDAFLAKLIAETEKLKVGDPTVRDVYLGPVINEAAVATYQKAIAEIKSSNGKILTGGRAHTSDGHFVEPTIVDGIPRDHRINKEELFVPVLSIVEVDDLTDAIRVANGATPRTRRRRPSSRCPHTDVPKGESVRGSPYTMRGIPAYLILWRPTGHESCPEGSEDRGGVSCWEEAGAGVSEVLRTPSSPQAWWPCSWARPSSASSQSDPAPREPRLPRSEA